MFGCTNCVNCKCCFDCHDLTDKEWYINNKPCTEDEWYDKYYKSGHDYEEWNKTLFFILYNE